MHPALSGLSDRLKENRLAVACALIAALFFALAAERGTALLRNLQAVSQLPAMPGPGPSASARRVHTSAALSLFGKPTARTGSAPARIPGGLTLAGVIAAESPVNGSAMIALTSGKTRLVHAGQPVMDSVVLEQVYSDYVVLRSGAQRLELRLAKNSVGTSVERTEEQAYRAELSSDVQKQLDIRKRLLQLRAKQ